MMVPDKRKDFIISTAGSYFAVPKEILSPERYYEDSNINTFLDGTEPTPMYAIHNGDGLLFSEEYPQNEEGSDPNLNSLIFFKVKYEPVSDENFRSNISIVSIRGSHLQGLYHALTGLFKPNILQDNIVSMRPKLANLLHELEEELKNSVFHSTQTSPEINSIDEEIQYWKTIGESGNRRVNSDDRKSIANSLTYLSSQVKSFTTLPESDTDDTLENIMNILDDLWKHDLKYPCDKMVTLLTMIGIELVRSLQLKMKDKADLFNSNSLVDNQLEMSSALCEKWKEITMKLTSLYWPHYAINPWTREPFIPEYSNGFMNRLNQVRKLRNIHMQVQILFVDDNKEIDFSSLQKPFKGINYLLYNQHAEAKWTSAVSSFYEALHDIEPDIVEVLRSKFRAYGSSLTALIMELRRFDMLLQLPNVLSTLSPERQNFLEQLHYNVSSSYSPSFAEAAGTVTRNLEVSRLIFPIEDARKNWSKLEIFSNFGKDALNDLMGYGDFLADVDEVKIQLKELEERQFKVWTENVLAALKTNEYRFATSDPVVSFESEKLLQVNFSDKLFDLINDTRKLTAYGFVINQKIVDTASKAQQFLEQAKLLFQVATFHNTMSERIIASQAPMMLNSARELARLVQSEHSVTFENTKEVNEYIKKLQAAVENLANENARLVKYHAQVMRKVESLIMAPVSDFIKRNDVWQRTMSEIRTIVEEVEEKFADTMAWRRHIDFQICKVLDMKYRWYLGSIDDNLPAMQITMVYRNQRVEYSPSLSALKKEYFSKIKDSVDKLLEIRGIGDEKIFPSIKEKNSDKLYDVIRCIELLFLKLKNYCSSWQSWLVTSKFEIESLFQSRNALKSEEWNRNFRASKFFGQQVAKLPDSYVIGPFTISLVPLKMSLEWLNRSSWSSLKELLKKAILEDEEYVRSFIVKVGALTDGQAQKADEFINFRLEHQSLQQELEMILRMAPEMINNETLLRNWTRESVRSVADTTAALAQARTSLKNFDVLLQQQIDVFRKKVHAQAKQLTTTLQLFFLKWNEERHENDLFSQPMTTAQTKSILLSMREKIDEWNDLNRQMESTRSDFAALDLEPPKYEEFNDSINNLMAVTEEWIVLENFYSGLDELGSKPWTEISGQAYQITENYLGEWKTRFKTLQPPSLGYRILEDIKLIEAFLPQLDLLGSDVLSDKHWADILDILGIQKPREKLLYNDLLAIKDTIITHSNQLRAINAEATSEIGVIQALTELDAWELEAKFTTFEHTDHKGETVVLIKDVKGILSKIGDFQCLLQSIKASSSLTKFADRVNIWETRLNNLDACIQDMIEVQRKWAYLEPIFGNWDLEGIKFDRINKEWAQIRIKLSESTFRVTSLSRMPGIHTTLQNLLHSLSQCQRALQNFLETKRLHFPRFYFLNDDDLLEILGQSDKPHVILKHLKKIFVGINSVEIENRGSNQVVSMVYSAHGESVVLQQPVLITSEAGEWLTNLSDQVRATLKALLVGCISKPDPSKYPAQILCLAERINFTQSAEDAIRGKSLAQYHEALLTQHSAYSSQLLEMNGSSKEKHGVLCLKLKDLLFDTIHHLSIIKSLMESNVRNIEDWMWQKTLRFYCDSHGTTTVKMVDAQFRYSFEYQGNIQKLVHTSLTDKCYLTLTQAASMGFGGNPYGPAGTGKTESVKALGALLGRQVLVFNCDEGLDSDSMMRIMIGIIKSGAWGCFDEFNRLDQTTLSQISLQISIIQHALRNNHDMVTLLGRQVSLNSDAGIFITLNPAGKGYGGRQKLPENLKQLFRPVLMSKPDDAEITQVLLHCEGFTKADEISQKIVTLFEQSKSLLSHQHHYDWGLRAIKTVAGSCGSSLRNFLGTNRNATEADEFSIAVNAIRLNTRCKLTYDDAIRFEELTNVIFPNIIPAIPSKQNLYTVMKEAYHEMDLCYNDKQYEKCVEVLEQMEQRMGVVVVGPQCTGKTSIILLLKKAMEKLGVKIRHEMFNPKSMTRQELLGQIDLDTREWSDGLLTHIAQSVYNETADVQCWIHLDGDVDPEWIESLNSVLDDNHLLTLPSGWRIQFGNNVHFIFETHDLKFASPATISRMGIILLSDRDLDYNTCINKWLRTPSSDAQAMQLVEECLPAVLKGLQETGEFQGSKKSINGILHNVLPFLENVKSGSELAFTLSWVIGAMLPPTDSPSNLNSKISKVIFNSDRDYQQHAMRDGITREFNEANSLQTEDGLILVPSLVPVKRLISECVVNNRPLIIIGPAGSGKSCILNHVFSSLSNREIISIDCNAYLKPRHVLSRINQVCMAVTQNSKRVIIPKNSEQRVIIHFSDLDAIPADKYGSRILIEFLKQAIERKGFYDDQFEWVGLEGLMFVFTVRYIDSLPARFVDLLHTVFMKTISLSELKEVVTMMSSCKLGDIENRQLLTALHYLIDDIYNDGSERSNPFKKHMFSLRELNMLVENLAMHDLSSLSSIVEAYICEARRVFKDQIDCNELRGKFDVLLEDSVRSGFGIDYVGLLYEDCYFIARRHKVPSTMKNHQNNSTIQHTVTKLEKLTAEDWKTDVHHACIQLGNYVTENTLLVPDFLDLLAKVEFILQQPGGSILFPSKPGSGKKTALQIVGQRLNFSLYPFKLNASYTISNFQNDLKTVIQFAGVNGENVVLLLEDFQIVEPAFLNMVSCLISHGEVFGLYTADELEAFSAQLKPSMDREQYEDSCISYLRKRVQSNIHLVLIYEYDNVSFLEWFRSDPSLSKICHTIYSNEFSSDTMFAIPEAILKKDKNHSELKESLEKTANFLSQMHGEVKKQLKNVTPLSFFCAIKTYLTFFNNNREELLDRRRRLQVGITKIAEAQGIVDRLKFEANEQKVLLDERQAKGRLVLDQISETMTRANSSKNDMEKLKSDAVNKNSALAARKLEIDKELESITPLVEAAQQAVGNIKPEALTEIRSLRVPPKIIRDILEAVLCLMGILDTSWSSMKSFLAGRGIRDEIRFFDARQITDENRSSVLKLLQANKDSFDIKNARRASVAAAPLAAWVQANVKYSIVLEKIRPLNEELAELETNINQAAGQINELETALANVDDTVAELKNQLSSSTKEAAEIEVRLANAEKTISAAEGLVLKLNDEFTVWNIQLTELTRSMEILPTNCAVSAGFVTYLPKADPNMRLLVIERLKTCLDEKIGVSIKDFLMTDLQVLHWQSEGLPGDEYSLQNAAILLNTMVPLLLLDPASTAVKWLMNHFQDANVESVSMKSSKFVNSLELAVKFGKVLVILDADQIPPLLIPILRRDFVFQGPRRMVYVGNKLVDYDLNFRIFLAARSLSLKQRAAIPGFISIVNFTPTVEGLTQQLLSCVLRIEKPDLETRRLELLQEEQQLKNKLYFLQEKVLKELVESQGDILQNQELLDSLKKTKESSDAIKQSLEEAVSVKIAMTNECAAYKSFALLGTRMFFACASMSNVNNMYHLSVNRFISLFEKYLVSQKKNTPVEEKSQNLVKFVYHNISRSLFNEDRLTLAMQLIQSAYSDTFNPGEWEFFIGTKSYSGSGEHRIEDLPAYIVDEVPTKNEVLNLKITCPTLYGNLKLDDAKAWSSFLTQSNPRLPDHCALTPFQYILVIKVLRPDLLYNELNNYALKKLGLTSLSPDVLKLEKLLEESDGHIPILIITSPGTDPSDELRNIARNLMKDMKEMVVGPGLEDAILDTLNEASKTGEWILLKNLHLLTHWLPVLESEIQEISAHNHKDFRLWMTTEAHDNFPEVLLSATIKISYEAPPGIRNNLLRTYQELQSQNLLESSDDGARAIFLLAWFHALIQERRTYIPQGWTSFYEFNDVDLMVAINVMKTFVSKSKKGGAKWEYLHGLYENAVYGGRVNNIYDLRVLSTYLQSLFNDETFKRNGRQLAVDVFLPSSADIREHIKIIQSLSNENVPEYFGLPPNVEVIRHRVVIRKLYQQFTELNKLSVLQDVTLEEMAESIEKLWNYWVSLRKRLNNEQSDKTDLETKVSVVSFIGLEVEFGKKLVSDVHSNFEALRDVIKQGLIPNRGTLEGALAIYNNKVPDDWANMWSGPRDPSSWLESAVSKILAARQLLNSNKTPLLSHIDLADFFHGADFFVALKQDAARNQKVPIEQLQLRCSLSADTKSHKIGSVQIASLLLEGALVVGDQLEMTSPDSPSVSEILLPRVSWEVGSNEGFISIPLYSNDTREEVIAELNIPCQRGENSKWIKAGTAFYARS
ncbi:heavy chain [Nesidiocoris tenuis]|uniref:Heavy chain n=2 Tax=Nesidiocoris tenuis TaxID=355587 RepID=A0ABN7AFY7_9HEMI|nr:heavy chain [Nesidiocoris tenuis]